MDDDDQQQQQSYLISRLILIIGLVITAGAPLSVESINWIGLHRHFELHSWNWTSVTAPHLNNNSAATATPILLLIKSTCWSAVRLKVLSKEQGQLCRQNPAVMSAVWEAGQLSSAACRAAFVERRWNCTSVDFLPKKTPDLNRGTREQAWLYALSSASLTRSISRGCSSGSLSKFCSCGSFPRHPPDGQFKWGGCGDDIKFGKKFAKTFTDISLRRAGRKSSSQKLLKVATTADSSTTTDLSSVLAVVAAGSSVIPPPSLSWKMPHIMAAVNMHNNRVGRKLAEHSLQTQCKCHGVSGSCQVKTCWRSLPSVAEMAHRMKRLYGMAVEVVPRRPNDMRRSVMMQPNHVVSTARLTAVHHNPHAPPSLMASSAGRDGGFNEHDLIYITKSPDYCRKDRSSGSLGTVGRSCNASAAAYGGSCSSLCCGRGYVTSQVEQVERCNCKYIWCCTVRCQTCRRQIEVHTCK